MYKIFELNEVETGFVAGGTSTAICDFNFDCEDSEWFVWGETGPCAPSYLEPCAEKYKCREYKESNFTAYLGYGTLLVVGFIFFVGAFSIRRGVRMVLHKRQVVNVGKLL